MRFFGVISDSCKPVISKSKISEFALHQNLSSLEELIDKKVSYDLVIKRSASRKLLIQALKDAQEQLILVCPWLTQYAIQGDRVNASKLS